MEEIKEIKTGINKALSSLNNARMAIEEYQKLVEKLDELNQLMSSQRLK
tara:strand:- start:109 stop:255 length:147 start_codon:yes stop_codon:yes gene_type:complete